MGGSPSHTPKLRRFLRAVLKITVALVMTVIGGAIVAFVAAPRITHCGHMRRPKAMADIRGIEEALHLFHVDCGFYPTTHDGLEALVSAKRASAECGKYSPEPYLNNVPLDPWGNHYAYISDGPRYTIKSYGADGKEGGERDDADIDSRDRVAAQRLHRRLW